MVNYETEKIVSDKTLSERQKKDLLISKITQNLEKMSVDELTKILNQTEKTGFISSTFGNKTSVHDVPIINAKDLHDMKEEKFIPLTEHEALLKKVEYERKYNRVVIVFTEYRKKGKKPQKGYTFMLYGKKNP